MRTKVFSVVTALLLFGSFASAKIIINITEVGSDVVLSASGSAYLDGLSWVRDYSSSSNRIYSAASFLHTGVGSGTEWSGISGPDGSVWGTGDSVAANGTSTTGSKIGLTATSITLPRGYTAGTDISTTSIWENSTFDIVALNPGTYTWTWGSGDNMHSLVMNVGTVPEPATMALLGLGGLFIRRRRKA